MVGRSPVDVGAHLRLPSTGLGDGAVLSGRQVDNADGSRLTRFRLAIHETRAQVRPVGEGIPFLGFVVYPNVRRLKRRNGVNYARRFRALTREYAQGRITLEQLTASARGWANHARYGDTLGLRRDVLGGVALRTPRRRPVS